MMNHSSSSYYFSQALRSEKEYEDLTTESGKKKEKKKRKKKKTEKEQARSSDRFHSSRKAIPHLPKDPPTKVMFQFSVLLLFFSPFFSCQCINRKKKQEKSLAPKSLAGFQPDLGQGLLQLQGIGLKTGTEPQNRFKSVLAPIHAQGMERVRVGQGDHIKEGVCARDHNTGVTSLAVQLPKLGNGSHIGRSHERSTTRRTGRGSTAGLVALGDLGAAHPSGDSYRADAGKHNILSSAQHIHGRA
jgi:hypothetical protein